MIVRLIACGGATLQTGANGMRTVALTEQNWRTGSSCMHPEYAQLFQDQYANDVTRNPDQAPYLADRTEAELTTLVGLDADGRDVKIQVWAGQPEIGMLLQSWELVSDEALPAERVPAATFDANPPAALQRLAYLENQPGRPAPYSVTITQALALAQTPLFELSTTSAVSETSAITSTGAITSTSAITSTTPPFLNSIIAGPPPNARGTRLGIEGQSLFDQALRDGFAIRFRSLGHAS
jgi:hypothetical protein